MKKYKLRKNCNRVIAIVLATCFMIGNPISNGYYSSFSDVLNSKFLEVNANEKLNIISSEGNLESAYITWNVMDNIDLYKVYYKIAGQADNEYIRLDNQLIRRYSDYFRADILGLERGSYDIKVVAIRNGEEITTAVKEDIVVKNHIREGFAFAKESLTQGIASGGYSNENGEDNAERQIVYVTQENVNAITLDVITNSKKQTTTATGLAEILKLRAKGYDTRNLIIRIIGTLKAENVTGINSNGYLEIKKCQNTTIEGVGDDATLYGFGMLIRDATNIEIRNLGFMLFSDDGISLDTGNNNIWIHNNDIFYGAPGSDSDQVKGDGSCDVKKFSNYITISYNHFWDSGKASLCGLKEEQEYFVTYHHNWFDHSDSRHPRIRLGSVHIYNNYYDGNAKYGVGVTTGASAYVEKNVFRNCKYPMLSSLQGTEFKLGNKTFSGESGGMIKAYDNTITGASSIIYASEDMTQFDAYDAKTRDEQVPDTYVTYNGNTTYNNFDTKETMYEYTPTDVTEVVNNVTTYAGRVENGDFEWHFNNETDDSSSDINAELKNKIVNYTSNIVSVGGENNNSTQEEHTSEQEGGSTQSVIATTQCDNGSTTTSQLLQTTTTSQVLQSATTTQQSNDLEEHVYWTVGGATETLYAEWDDHDVQNAQIYYKRMENSNYQLMKDKSLLQQLSNTKARVDILGLEAGSYDLKIVSSDGIIYNKSGIKVESYDRSGYAHYQYNAGVGAYNDDGTLKENAIVILVSNKNKDTVTVPGYESYATGIGNILNGNGNSEPLFKALAEDNKALAIRIVGNVEPPSGLTEYNGTGNGGTAGDNGNMALIRNAKNITIEGVGTDACINGWGISFLVGSGSKNYESYEVRNITFRNAPEDALGFQGTMSNNELTNPIERVWVHNNAFYPGYCANPAESDKAEGDGSCDFKRGQYFTMSYNYYENCHKTNLMGANDSNLQYNVTMHHNYYNGCGARMPLVRQANIHIYNNYFKNASSSVIDARANAFVYSEANYFESCKDAVKIDGTAVVKSYGDKFDNCTNKNNATIVSEREENVVSSNKYANFDVDTDLFYYDYSNKSSKVSNLNNADDAKAICIAQSGVVKQVGEVLENKDIKTTESNVTTSEVPEYEVTTEDVEEGENTTSGVPEYEVTTEDVEEGENTTSGVPEYEVTTEDVEEGENTTSGVPEYEVTTEDATESENTTSGVPEYEVTTEDVEESERTTAGVPEYEVTTEDVEEGEITTAGVPEYEITTEDVEEGENTTSEIPEYEVTTEDATESERTTAGVPEYEVTTEDVEESERTTSRVPEYEVTTEDVEESERTTSRVPEYEVTTEDVEESERTTARVPEYEVTTEDVEESERTTSGVPEYEVTTEDVEEGERTTARVPEYEVTTEDAKESENTTSGVPEYEVTTEDVEEGENTTSEVPEYEVTTEDVEESERTTSGVPGYEVTTEDVEESERTTSGVPEYEVTTEDVEEGENTTSGVPEYEVTTEDVEESERTTSGVLEYEVTEQKVNSTEDSNAGGSAAKGNEFSQVSTTIATTAANIIKETQENVNSEEGVSNVLGSLFIYKNVNYKITMDEFGNYAMSVVGVNNWRIKKVVIANSITINGIKYNVVEIENNAFQNLNALKSVTIGKNVKRIGKKAFWKCKKCTAITIKGKEVNYIGKKAFTGISKKAKIIVKNKKMVSKIKKTGFTGTIVRK